MLLTTENIERYNELVDSLQSHQIPILFTGAGLSVESGAPKWSKLLTRLYEAVLRHQGVQDTSPASDQDIPLRSRGDVGESFLSRKDLGLLLQLPDPLFAAEVFRSLLPKGKYEALLRRGYGKTLVAGPTIMALTKLGFRHIVTTNYDNCAEQALTAVHSDLPTTTVAWNDKNSVREFFAALQNKSKRSYVAQLHGNCADCGTLILTEKDYVERYVLSNDSMPRLLALFMLHRVLIVGFSFTDPQFQQIFRAVNAHLGHGPARHYMLTPSTGAYDEANALMWKLKYGIVPIYYDAKSGDHGDLLRTIEKLGTDISRRGKTRSKDRVSKGRSWATGVYSNSRNEDDPRKGAFGGRSQTKKYKLSAKVLPCEDDRDYFEVEIILQRKNKKPFVRPVRFFLHPTFSTPIVTRSGGSSNVRVVRWAWGAFTVGVEIGDDMERLELDLSKMRGAPKKFRER